MSACMLSSYRRGCAREPRRFHGAGRPVAADARLSRRRLAGTVGAPRRPSIGHRGAPADRPPAPGRALDHRDPRSVRRVIAGRDGRLARDPTRAQRWAQVVGTLALVALGAIILWP